MEVRFLHLEQIQRLEPLRLVYLSRVKSSNVLKWAVCESRRKMKLRAVGYLGGKCEECGYFKCLEAMEFHHRDPTQKDFHLSEGNYRCWGKVKVEVDKCRLLCANCHREHHASDRRDKIEAQRMQADLERARQMASVSINCKQCGTEFSVSHCELELRSHCSLECAAKASERASWPSDEDLAKRVWEAPVVRLAEQLGVSEVAVKKRCKRRSINTPPRGYWKQRQAALNR